MRLEGLGQLRKNPITLSGIEPATFRLVAEYLNQLHYRVLFVSFLILRMHLFVYADWLISLILKLEKGENSCDGEVLISWTENK
jgi:hypothetical protein